MTKSNIEIKQIKGEQTWAIRHKVMWPEQPLDFIKLPNDDEGFHLGLFVNHKLISVISIFINEKEAQFRKLATLQNQQGKGYGTQLLHKVMQIAKQKQLKRIWCNARLNKTYFYTNFKLKVTENTFTKFGINYVVMERYFH